MYKTESQWEDAVLYTELSLVLYDDLEGWDGGLAESSRGKGYVCTYIIVVQQKLTQHCKAIILQ